MGSMVKCRETASLRASLKVYVIGLPFHRSPCMKSQPFPSVPHRPWAKGTLTFPLPLSMARYLTARNPADLGFFSNPMDLSPLPCNTTINCNKKFVNYLNACDLDCSVPIIPAAVHSPRGLRYTSVRPEPHFRTWRPALADVHRHPRDLYSGRPEMADMRRPRV
jgi:hypothetical protein